MKHIFIDIALLFSCVFMMFHCMLFYFRSFDHLGQTTPGVGRPPGHLASSGSLGPSGPARPGAGHGGGVLGSDRGQTDDDFEAQQVRWVTSWLHQQKRSTQKLHNLTMSKFGDEISQIWWLLDDFTLTKKNSGMWKGLEDFWDCVEIFSWREDWFAGFLVTGI